MLKAIYQLLSRLLHLKKQQFSSFPFPFYFIKILIDVIVCLGHMIFWYVYIIYTDKIRVSAIYLCSEWLFLVVNLTKWCAYLSYAIGMKTWQIKEVAEWGPIDLLFILPRSKRTWNLHAPPYSFMCFSSIHIPGFSVANTSQLVSDAVVSLKINILNTVSWCHGAIKYPATFTLELTKIQTWRAHLWGILA